MAWDLYLLLTIWTCMHKWLDRLISNYLEIVQVTYPNMMQFFESLGVDMEASDMSFAVSLDKGSGCEWGSQNGLSSLFAQKKNMINPNFWQMLREIVKFKHDALRQVILFPTLNIGNVGHHLQQTMFWKNEDREQSLYVFVAVILRCLRTTQTLIAMRHWDSLLIHGVTLNCFRKLILWDS